jgi:two-component system KDP operon response regulator KdpE
MKGIFIEDDAKIVEFVTISLQIGWPEFELLCADTGKKGIDLVKKESPDIVLLDLGLPDINGFEVLKSIRLFSNVLVIIATVSNEEADVIKGLQLGADEYIVKPFRQLELMARIKSLINRKKQNLEEVTAKDLVLGPWHIDSSRNRLYDNEKEIHLTITELNILMHLIRNAGQIVSLSSIAKEIWGTDYTGSNHAIRVYIQRLREKIEPQVSAPSLILTKPGIGYYVEKL